MEAAKPTASTSVDCGCDSSDSEALDTSQYIQQQQCNLRGLRKSKINWYSLNECQELNISESWVKTLQADYLTNLVTLLADYSRLGSLDTAPLRRLRVLNLQGCPIAELQTAGLSQLRELNVSYTKLEALDLKPMTSLKVLAIESTAIELQKNDDLSGMLDLNVAGTNFRALNTANLRRLEILNMNNCAIETLNTTNLVSLVKLLIGKSKISELNLAPMKKLCALFVERTHLNVLAADQSQYLEVLDLSYCMIDSLTLPGSQPRCSKPGSQLETAISQVAKYDLDSLPSGHFYADTLLSTPFPTYNPVMNLHFNALEAASSSNLLRLNLESVTISFINTENMVKLTWLIITRTQIKGIDLRPMTQLKVFRAYNTAIKTLDLTPCYNLSNLEIGNSYISRINISCVAKFEFLSISKSKIKYLNLPSSKSYDRLRTSLKYFVQ